MRNTPKKALLQESFPMGSKDKHITLLLICYPKNLFDGMASLSESFRYKRKAGGSNLSLYLLAKFLESILNSFKNLFNLFFLYAFCQTDIKTYIKYRRGFKDI